MQRICLPGVRQQRDFSTELTAALLLDRGNARSLDDRLPSTLGRTAILLIRRRTEDPSYGPMKCPTTSDRPYVTADGDNFSVKIPPWSPALCRSS